MTTRIAPGVGANLLGQHSAERNQDATAYVGNLDPQVSEELLWELFVQAGPVVNVYVPKDRVTNSHQGYGFVEFRSEEDADYAIKVLNMIKLYGKPIRVNKASQDKKSVDVGANLFIGNLDPDVDEKLLYDTFSAFGVIVTNPKIMRDPETGNSRGFGFISYDSFEASDAAIEAMTGQYLCNRQITVSYAYKKDTKGERHGTPAERVLAASNPNVQKSRPHTLFASGPPTLPNVPQANGAISAPVPPRPFANGSVPPPPLPALRPPPPQHGLYPPVQIPTPQPWQGQPQQGQPGMPPQPMQQYRSMPPPPPMQMAPPLSRPPPVPAGMTAPNVWRPPPPPQQLTVMHHSMQQMSMPPPPPPGPVIIGAGPSGLASAACLKKNGIPFLVLEKECCLASLWKAKTYDHLTLHLPKKFCELPYMSFPRETPHYPGKQQFISYLESYAKSFSVVPMFRQEVKSATYDSFTGIWHIKTSEFEFLCQWLIVATGENAVPVVPEIPGLKEFRGTLLHTSNYKNGAEFRGRKVLVVGSGNSGMEVCLDLCKSGAQVSLLARHKVHILPRDLFGTSTFALSIWLLKWFPVKLVDYILILCSHLTLGDTCRVGLDRPKAGPLELKNATGRTPVLDIGAIAKIRSGEIKVVRDIHRIVSGGVEFVDGKIEEYESIILATGYRTNITSWLKVDSCQRDEYHPEKITPRCWKGDFGLYSVGFSGQGLLGTSREARMVAEDIARQWSCEQEPLCSI